MSHAPAPQSSLTPADLRRLAQLAHLHLPEARAAELCTQLASVLDSMAVLRTLPLHDLEALTHVSEAATTENPHANTLGPDVVGEHLPAGIAASLPRSTLSAREDLAAFVHVPKVLGASQPIGESEV